MAYVCQEWEKASDAAKSAGIRVVYLRMGAVLGKSGGMLEKFGPLVRACLGGTWGTGKQKLSWIALDDLLEIIHFVIHGKSIIGPVNAVSPSVVSNYQFTKILGRCLSRPTLFSIPEVLAKLAFGEWANSTLLGDYNIVPKILLNKGYKFRFADLESALRHTLV